MTDQTARGFAAPPTPRIFCIGRNYADHIAELGNMDGQQCVIFMKPISALVASGTDVPVPTDQGAVHYEAELVVEIGTGGGNIRAEDAPSHISALGLGLDMTLRDLQYDLKSTGEPWDKCKAFDHSAPLGPMRPFDGSINLDALEFRLTVNDELRQHGRTELLLVNIPELIARVSAHWQLLPGDLIYTGTPDGVGEVQPGDRLQLDGPQLPAAGWTISAA